MKKFLAVLAAACLVFGMVGCQQNDVSTGQEQTSAESSDTIITNVKEEETEADTKSETTSALKEADLVIETLAEGEERDYNIEDILKNDLEIDGIPVSIPCTLNELLEALGDDYSVDTTFLTNEQESYSLDVLYNNEKTMLSTVVEVENNGNDDYINYFVKGINCFEMNSTDNESIISINFDKGKIGFKDLTDNFYDIVSKYELPNEFISENNRRKIRYNNEDCYISCTFEDDILKNLLIEYKGNNKN